MEGCSIPRPQEEVPRKSSRELPGRQEKYESDIQGPTSDMAWCARSTKASGNWGGGRHPDTSQEEYTSLVASFGSGQGFLSPLSLIALSFPADLCTKQALKKPLGCLLSQWAGDCSRRLSLRRASRGAEA